MTILYEPERRNAQQLGMLFGSDLHTVATAQELAAALGRRPDELLVLFGPGAEITEVAAFVAEQRVARPALGVLLLCASVDVTVLGEAMRAGVREVVDAADIGAVRTACARSLALSQQLAGASAASTGSADGRVVTVFAAKGGCGKTTMAVNLAVALADGGRRRVCVVDLDLAFGDVAIMLQLAPQRTVADAIPMTGGAHSAGRVDETALRSLVTPYCPGVDALLAPTRPTDGDHVTRGLVSDLLAIARRLYDFVVVDTPPQFTDHVLAALDASDQYVLLATPDLPALKNLRITLDMFNLLDYPAAQRLVVLNRADAKVGLTGADIDRVISAPITAHIPSSRDVPVSINRGVPLLVDSPNHPASKAIRSLANSRIASPQQQGGGRGLRGLFSRRKGGASAPQASGPGASASGAPQTAEPSPEQPGALPHGPAYPHTGVSRQRGEIR
ncbi:MAG: AAA family ATPase [Micromonosporaceae bacterium]|nr:AAA family ATPase [Micromonosporaceae bacterium]